MADGSAATPGSSASKTPAAKDRECPYCHQAFTSSSLGRHLDLYIKDKNAKPPDDLHNVEEIRRMRGNVTRRQARSSAGKRESSAASSKLTPFRDQRSPSTQGGFANMQHSDGAPGRTVLNRLNWHSTGVINDLPPVPREDESPFGRRPSRGTSVKQEIIHKQNALDERERARAAELALQEVLGSVKAAKYVEAQSLQSHADSSISSMRAHPPSPFNFNFFSLSFPELCLQCLSAPHTLLAGSAVPDPFSWSLETPKPVYHDILREWLGSKLKELQPRGKSHHFPNQIIQPNGTNGHSQESEGTGEVEEKYYQHLTSVYESWKTLTEKQKQDSWRTECAKAFAREQEKHKKSIRSLELAEQEIQHLRSQLAHRNPYDHSTEYTHFGISPLPLSRETAKNIPELPSYEALLSRWRTRLAHQRSVQNPLPPLTPWATATPPNLSNDHMNGTHQYPPPPQRDDHQQPGNEQDQASDEDEDLADAPGDDDISEQQQQLGMDKGMLDPNLRDGDGAEDMDGEGGRVLMELREAMDIGRR